ncbi:MAG: Hpt domain-containing protein [Bacteriovoracaceae bacterium]|nr:Hpt domain-containing protein [Bacteriovoracaceae bacterium]
MNELKVRENNLEHLLNSINEGFMFFDRSGVIEIGCTNATEVLFGMAPEGKHLGDLLRFNKEEKKELDGWLEAVFDGLLDFYDLIEVAPKFFDKLNDRYIELNFHPVFSENDSPVTLEKVICVAVDQTKMKQYQNQCAQEAAMARMVISILRDRSAFEGFVIETRSIIKEMKASVLNEQSDVEIDEILRGMHSVKGNAACFHVTKVSQLAHLFENKLESFKNYKGEKLKKILPVLSESIEYISQALESFLRENVKIIGEFGEDDVTRFKQVSLKNIYSMSNLIYKEFGKKSSMYQKFVQEFVQEDIAHGFLRYEDLVYSLAARQEKLVKFEIVHSGIMVCMEPYIPLLGAYVHVFRNIMDHGLEGVMERESLSKPKYGAIKVTFEEKLSDLAIPQILIKVMDDGRGIDSKKIKNIAMKKGIATAEEIETLDCQTLQQLIFHSGLSTSKKVSDLSGRGVGLAALKDAVDNLGGNIWVESIVEEGTTFYVEVPIFETREIKHTTSDVISDFLNDLS